MDKMTLDDLVNKFEEWYKTDSPLITTTRDSLRGCINYIKANRESLESGMRPKPIRCKRINGWWVAVDENNTPLTPKFKHVTHNWIISHLKKKSVEYTLSQLGLSAEFIDDKEDHDATGQGNT